MVEHLYVKSSCRGFLRYHAAKQIERQINAGVAWVNIIIEQQMSITKQISDLASVMHAKLLQ